MPSRGNRHGTLNEAYVALLDVFGGNTSLTFGVALITAGLASSLVTTMAGQTVMDGVLDLNVWIRPLVTLVPSLAIVITGFDPTSVLVASIVALSFELPFVLIPLLWFTYQENVIGSFQNQLHTTYLLTGIIGLIVVLNI